MMMMMMTMMTNTIPYRRTKNHKWDKVLMGIWVHPIKSTIRMITSWWEKEASSTPLAASSLSPGWSRPSERAGSFTSACKFKFRNLYFPEKDDNEPSPGCFTKFWLRIFGLCVRHIYGWVVDLYRTSWIILHWSVTKTAYMPNSPAYFRLMSTLNLLNTTQSLYPA